MAALGGGWSTWAGAEIGVGEAERCQKTQSEVERTGGGGL